jgi:Mn-containing catalase
MTPDIAHRKSFEKALYAITPNFPPGKLPGMQQFTSVYSAMSQGGSEVNGAWNSGPDWTVVSDRAQQAAVDGGDGHASVAVTTEENTALAQMAARTASDPTASPMTGAQLGAGSNPGAGDKVH